MEQTDPDKQTVNENSAGNTLPGPVPTAAFAADAATAADDTTVPVSVHQQIIKPVVMPSIDEQPTKAERAVSFLRDQVTSRFYAVKDGFPGLAATTADTLQLGAALLRGDKDGMKKETHELGADGLRVLDAVSAVNLNPLSQLGLTGAYVVAESLDHRGIREGVSAAIQDTVVYKVYAAGEAWLTIQPATKEIGIAMCEARHAVGGLINKPVSAADIADAATSVSPTTIPAPTEGQEPKITMPTGSCR